ncbi:MAG: HEAT repeat domain-containing protein [Candidatus Thorarchaeota archaeon]
MNEVRKKPKKEYHLILFSEALKQSLIEEVIAIQEERCEYASFEETHPANLRLDANERAEWLWIASKGEYEGKKWDWSTDRLSGDPYSAEVFRDWIGKMKSAPKQVSNIGDLDEWALLSTRYVREYTDVGSWGVHEDRFVEDVTSEGLVIVSVVGNRRFQDVPPSATTGRARVDLNLFESKSTNELVLLLHDSNSLIREIAAKLLGRTKESWTVDHLILSTDDEAKYVRISAIEALGKIGGDAAIQKLCSILSESEYPDKAAQEALAKIGEPALESIIPMLAAESDHTSNAAAALVANIGGREAANALIDAIDERRAQRAMHTLHTIIQSLGDMQSIEALERIADCLHDADMGIQVTAAKALGSLMDQRSIKALVDALYTCEYMTRKTIVESLERLGWTPTGEYHAWVYYIKEDWAGLFALGDDAIEAILRALEEKDSSYQGKILAPLANSGITLLNSKVADAIIKIYRSDNQKEYVKVDALGALACTPTLEVMSFLVKEYMNPDTDYFRRKISNIIEKLVLSGNEIAGSLVTNLMEMNSEGSIGKGIRYGLSLLTIVPLSQSQLKMLVPLMEIVKQRTRDKEIVDLVSGLLLLDQIRSDFSAPEFQVRKKAIEAIDKYHLPSAIEPLIKALGDAHQYIRDKAIRAIDNIGVGAIVNTITALENDDYRIRMGAAEALGRLRFAQAAEPLLNALDDKNEIVRQNAAWALGKLYLNQEMYVEIKGKVIEALVRLMNSDDHLPARANAVLSLANLEDERAINWLFEAMNQPIKEFRLNASFGFIRLAHILPKESEFHNRVIDKMIAALDDPVKEVRYNAVDGLRLFMGKKAKKALVALRDDPDEELRDLAKIGVEEIEKWGDNDRASWSYTERAYYLLRDPKAIEELIPFFMEDDLKVQRETQIQISKFGDIAYDKMMKLLLDKEQHYRVRMGAAATLGDIGDTRAIYALIDALHDAHEDVRCNAAWALAELKDERSVEALSNAMKDTNWQVRVNVAAAFGKIGGRSAFNGVVQLIDDDHPEVRLVATSYLAHFDEPEVMHYLQAKLRDDEKKVRDMAKSWIKHLESRRSN